MLCPGTEFISWGRGEVEAGTGRQGGFIRLTSVKMLSVPACVSRATQPSVYPRVSRLLGGCLSSRPLASLVHPGEGEEGSPKGKDAG